MMTSSQVEGIGQQPQAPADPGLEAVDAPRADLEIQRLRVRAPPGRAVANDREIRGAREAHAKQAAT
jgi:hypothetical protein